MGSLTQNYNLYKPDVGEVDWGDEVNQNFDTLDALIKELEEQVEYLKKKLGSSLVGEVAIVINSSTAFEYAKEFERAIILATSTAFEYAKEYSNTLYVSMSYEIS